jgi:glycosyltransferase involved in cell wall biosynthesis
MKLVVLTNIIAPYRIPLFEAIRRRVDDFSVLLMAEREENRQWQLGAIPFKTERLPGFHFKPGGHDVSLHINYSVVRALRKLDPDVVISGGFGPANLSALLYCKMFRRKFVGWGHLTLSDGAESSFMRRAVRRWLIRRCDGAIAESSDAREAFMYYGAKSDRVLPCVMPLDVRRIHDRTNAFRNSTRYGDLTGKYPGPIVLSIGQAIPRKGYRELFQIYERIVASRPDVSLLVIGDGPERARYERLVFERGWRRVHFIGFVQSDDIHQYLAIADVFVFHTLYDPFGLVLSEAMAAELPAVSSIYASATRDLIEDGATGFRIDPKDIGSSAAMILKVLVMKPEERTAMGRAAYTKVKQCDAEASGETIVRFVQSLVRPEMRKGTL